jgi:hypothetical protein
MPEPTPDGARDGTPDRAELAFRDAFTRYADDLEPRSLAAPVRRRRWPATVAAAAAVVVLVGVTFAVAGDRDRDEVAGTPTTSGSSASETPTPSPSTSSVPLRNVTYRGVSVDVPAGWVDSYIPEDSGCAYAPEPFVATSQPAMVSGFPLCLPADPVPSPPKGFPRARPAEWVPNVQLLDVTGAVEPMPDGSRTYEGWTLTRRTVGDVVVQTLVDAGSAALAQDVLASSREVAVDANGCRSSSPVQEAAAVRPPAFDVTRVQATSIVVCLYGRGDPTRPGMLASRRLEGAEAQEVLTAIRTAPSGGGPDQPQNCLPEDFGDLALSLRLDDGDVAGPELYVTFQSCHDNGIDDGTTVRKLTPKSCRPLFGDRVQFNSGSAASYRVCHPRRGGS